MQTMLGAVGLNGDRTLAPESQSKQCVHFAPRRKPTSEDRAPQTPNQTLNHEDWHRLHSSGSARMGRGADRFDRMRLSSAGLRIPPADVAHLPVQQLPGNVGSRGDRESTRAP